MDTEDDNDLPGSLDLEFAMPADPDRAVEHRRRIHRKVRDQYHSCGAADLKVLIEETESRAERLRQVARRRAEVNDREGRSVILERAAWYEERARALRRLLTYQIHQDPSPGDFETSVDRRLISQAKVYEVTYQEHEDQVKKFEDLDTLAAAYDPTNESEYGPEARQTLVRIVRDELGVPARSQIGASPSIFNAWLLAWLIALDEM